MIEEPDPVQPLITSLTQLFRYEFNRLEVEYDDQHQAGMVQLADDDSWQQLTPE